MATLRGLDELGILSVYGTVRPKGAGQPATLYVSLLGLAGSSPLRKRREASWAGREKVGNDARR